MINLKTVKINFEHVNKTFYTRYQETPVLHDVSFNVQENEIVALLGPSGAGKTTIFNLLSGLIKPDSGIINSTSNLGYMFQKDNLFEWLSIKKNISLGLKVQHLDNEEAEQNIVNLTTRYGLKDFLNHYPSELSGGMRQKVALIRTLVLKPDLLLLDEPFSALDYITRLDLEEEVHRIIKQIGISAMIVTHDISEALAFADRIYVLSSRPATIKKEYIMDFAGPENECSPSINRKSPKFKDYFASIVEDLK